MGQVTPKSYSYFNFYIKIGEQNGKSAEKYIWNSAAVSLFRNPDPVTQKQYTNLYVGTIFSHLTADGSLQLKFKLSLGEQH